MPIEVKPLAEITHTAIRVLCRKIGVVNMVRFINQFTTGYGNYTEERNGLFADMTLDDMIAAIKRRKKNTRRKTLSKRRATMLHRNARSAPALHLP